MAITTSVLQDFTATRCTHCSVNPLHNQYEYRRHIQRTPYKRRVAVIGGGPAGMQAAIYAADDGHLVTLYEKSECLGGIINYAQHIPFKHDPGKIQRLSCAAGGGETADYGRPWKNRHSGRCPVAAVLMR